MEKLDARKLPTAALEEKRCLSVKLRKEGMRRAQIGEVVGVHPDTVGRWLKAYEAQGAKALKSQVRGRREGACRRLTPEQESQLQKLLIDKTPEQLKFPYALWTREPWYQPTDAYRRTLSQALGHDRAKAGEVISHMRMLQKKALA